MRPTPSANDNARRGPATASAGGSLAQRIAAGGFDSDEEDDYDEVDPSLTLLQRVGHAIAAAAHRALTYATLNWSDIKNRKAAFCLGLCSVFVVVVITVLMVTTLGYLPVLFYRLGEIELGEMDVVVTPGAEASQAASLNYTRIAAMFPAPLAQSYHAPRVVFPSDFTQLTVMKRRSCAALIDAATGAASLPVSTLWRPASAAATTAVDNDALYKNCNTRRGCATVRCGDAGISSKMYAIDFLREERAQIGREYRARTPGPFECVLDQLLADALNVSVGDAVIVWADVKYPLRQAFVDAGLARQRQDSAFGATIVSLTVAAIVPPAAYGKLGNDASNFIFVDYASVNQVLGAGLSPVDVPTYASDAFIASDPYTMASQVLFNYPPASKSKMYSYTDWLEVLREASLFYTPIINALGINQVNGELPLVDYLRGARFFSLFLGLILSIVILVLAFLSIILIYAQLTTGVQTRVFELGVMRMVGMSRDHIAAFVVVGAMMFAVPALAIGLACGQALFLAVRAFLQSQLQVQVPWQLDGAAVGYGVLAALAIPALSSVAPILEVLSQQLPDALNTSRGKIQTIVYEIERAVDKGVDSAYIIFGGIMVVVGFLLYYLFPLSLLTSNFALLFYIFFALLVGMLFGFTLLAINFQRVFESVACYVFFFWETEAAFHILQKSLVAHRRRNKTTALMYATAVSFVIFITVAFGIELESQKYTAARRLGGQLRIGSTATRSSTAFGIGWPTAMKIDAHLARASGLPASRWGPLSAVTSGEVQWTWVTLPITTQGKVGNSSVDTLGRFMSVLANGVAVAPSFFDVADPTFVIVGAQQAAEPYTMSDWLYGGAGSSTVIVSSSTREDLALDDFSTRGVIAVSPQTVNGTAVARRRVFTPSAWLDASPVLQFSKFPGALSQDYAMSLPALLGRSEGGLPTIEQTQILGIVVRCKGQASASCPPGLAGEIREILRVDGVDSRVTEYDLVTRGLSTATTILNFFFTFTLVVAMWICFFSLSSSMSTNIYEQAKEIGVLRSIGLRKFPCWRIYVWEAFVIVAASSILGLVIGCLVAYTVLLQRGLFTQLPLPFVFPIQEFGIVVGMSVVFAFFSSFAPIRQLLAAPSVNTILRKQ